MAKPNIKARQGKFIRIAHFRNKATQSALHISKKEHKKMNISKNKQEKELKQV